MPDLAVVTVVTRNYLHYARALAVSVRETNPTVPVYICLVDRPPQPYDPSAEPGTVFFADELGTPDWKRFAFQYDGLELACALKPFAMRRVLDEGLRGVLYLDSDGLVYGPLSGIRERLGSGPVALTPHLDSPLPEDGRSPSEATILRAGVFNGGFVAVSGTPGGRGFLSWWSERLRRECINDPPSGIFVDQQWLDEVPAFFPDARIERGPGYNVAYWNLGSRSVRRDAAGRLMANDEPLVYFHFSGFNPELPAELSRYQDRFRLADLPVVAGMTRGFVQRLDAQRRRECQQWSYAYSRLTDGTPIDRAWREAVRVGHASVAGVADPFVADALPDWKSRLEIAGQECAGRRLGWVLEPLWLLEEECVRLRRQVVRYQRVLDILSPRRWLLRAARAARRTATLIAHPITGVNGARTPPWRRPPGACG